MTVNKTPLQPVNGTVGVTDTAQIVKPVDAAGNPTGASSTAASPASTATLANVSGSASSVTLQAANTARKGLHVFNDSASALYLKYGSTASATSFVVKIAAGQYWEMPTPPAYTGIVTGIWDSATGTARVTEL